MQGEKVPMAFFPRFSTFTSATVFWTQPMDLIGFEQIQLTVFRSMMSGGTPSLEFYLEESADGNDWEDMTAPFDPAAGLGNVEKTVQKSVIVARRFVRAGLKLMGTDPLVTVFMIGWAARTEA